MNYVKVNLLSEKLIIWWMPSCFNPNGSRVNTKLTIQI